MYKNIVFIYMPTVCEVARFFALLRLPSPEKGIIDVAHFCTNQCPQLCRRFLQKVVVGIKIAFRCKEVPLLLARHSVEVTWLCYWLVIQ